MPPFSVRSLVRGAVTGSCVREAFFVFLAVGKGFGEHSRVRERLASWGSLLLLLENWSTVAKKGGSLPIGDRVGDHGRRSWQRGRLAAIHTNIPGCV